MIGAISPVSATSVDKPASIFAAVIRIASCTGDELAFSSSPIVVASLVNW